MAVAPHPHMGLQTVSWLVRGTVLHRDSIGTTALVEPGRVAIMNAGKGIAHSENSPADHGPVLHGVQLWVALPETARESLGAGIPFPSRLGRPEEYASLVLQIVANPMLNGETIRLDGALRMPPK